MSEKHFVSRHFCGSLLSVVALLLVGGLSAAQQVDTAPAGAHSHVVADPGWGPRGGGSTSVGQS